MKGGLMPIKPSKENDIVRKQFRNVYSTPDFPSFDNEEYKKLIQLIVNYSDFKKDDKEHKSGDITFMNHNIKFEIKEREKLVREKYLLLSCEKQDRQNKSKKHLL